MSTCDDDDDDDDDDNNDDDQEALKDCGYLMTLSLKGNPIRRVHQDTFDNLKVTPVDC